MRADGSTAVRYYGTMIFIGQCIWLILPAYLANMAPLLAKKLLKDRFSTPIDSNRLGANKTFRGLIAGMVMGIAVAPAHRALSSFPIAQRLSLVPYESLNVTLWGFLLGAGALLGDAAKSFFKRQRGISPGTPWRPFDQLDFLVGAMALAQFVYVPPVPVILDILLLMPCLKIVSAHVGYAIGWRETRW